MHTTHGIVMELLRQQRHCEMPFACVKELDTEETRERRFRYFTPPHSIEKLGAGYAAEVVLCGVRVFPGDDAASRGGFIRHDVSFLQPDFSGFQACCQGIVTHFGVKSPVSQMPRKSAIV